MPLATFGKNLNLPSSGGKFIKLKAKGDKLKFRIAGQPVYETQHWIAEKQAVLCGRFNSEDKKALCQYCDQYQKLVDAGQKDEAKELAPVTTFYYPILHLLDDSAGIFQFTAKSIHYTIGGYADEGVDVFACDWSIERTEDPGNYYAVKRLGDKPLNEEQQDQYEVAKGLKINRGKESTSISLEEAQDIEPA